MGGWRPNGVLLVLFLLGLGTLKSAYGAPTSGDEDESEGGCYYMFSHYDEGDRILTNEPCLNCTCHNSMLMCYLRVCPFTKPIGQDCAVEKRPDQCCPTITCPEVHVSLLNPGTLITSTSTVGPPIEPTALAIPSTRGCNIEGQFYPDGAQVASDPTKPCELCYCIRNRTACVMQECILHVEGCEPIFQPGVCCPVRYHCDNRLGIEGTTTTSLIAGLISSTVASIFTTAPPSVGGCYREGDFYADGSQISTPGEAPCEHCYCMRGEIVCAVQDCGSPLENESGNCKAMPPPTGLCCPAKYACHLPSRENRLLNVNFTATANETMGLMETSLKPGLVEPGPTTSLTITTTEESGTLQPQYSFDGSSTGTAEKVNQLEVKVTTELLEVDATTAHGVKHSVEFSSTTEVTTQIFHDEDTTENLSQGESIQKTTEQSKPQQMVTLPEETGVTQSDGKRQPSKSQSTSESPIHQEGTEAVVKETTTNESKPDQTSEEPEQEQEGSQPSIPPQIMEAPKFHEGTDAPEIPEKTESPNEVATKFPDHELVAPPSSKIVQPQEVTSSESSIQRETTVPSSSKQGAQPSKSIETELPPSEKGTETPHKIETEMPKIHEVTEREHLGIAEAFSPQKQSQKPAEGTEPAMFESSSEKSTPQKVTVSPTIQVVTEHPTSHETTLQPYEGSLATDVISSTTLKTHELTEVTQASETTEAPEFQEITEGLKPHEGTMIPLSHQSPEPTRAHEAETSPLFKQTESPYLEKGTEAPYLQDKTDVPATQATRVTKKPGKMSQEPEESTESLKQEESTQLPKSNNGTESSQVTTEQISETSTYQNAMELLEHGTKLTTPTPGEITVPPQVNGTTEPAKLQETPETATPSVGIAASQYDEASQSPSASDVTEPILPESSGTLKPPKSGEASTTEISSLLKPHEADESSTAETPASPKPQEVTELTTPEASASSIAQETAELTTPKMSASSTPQEATESNTLETSGLLKPQDVATSVTLGTTGSPKPFDTTEASFKDEENLQKATESTSSITETSLKDTPGSLKPQGATESTIPVTSELSKLQETELTTEILASSKPTEGVELGGKETTDSAKPHETNKSSSQETADLPKPHDVTELPTPQGIPELSKPQEVSESSVPIETTQLPKVHDVFETTTPEEELVITKLTDKTGVPHQDVTTSLAPGFELQQRNTTKPPKSDEVTELPQKPVVTEAATTHTATMATQFQEVTQSLEVTPPSSITEQQTTLLVSPGSASTLSSTATQNLESSSMEPPQTVVSVVVEFTSTPSVYEATTNRITTPRVMTPELVTIREGVMIQPSSSEVSMTSEVPAASSETAVSTPTNYENPLSASTPIRIIPDDFTSTEAITTSVAIESSTTIPDEIPKVTPIHEEMFEKPLTTSLAPFQSTLDTNTSSEFTTEVILGGEGSTPSLESESQLQILTSTASPYKTLSPVTTHASFTEEEVKRPAGSTTAGYKAFASSATHLPEISTPSSIESEKKLTSIPVEPEVTQSEEAMAKGTTETFTSTQFPGDPENKHTSATVSSTIFNFSTTPASPIFSTTISNENEQVSTLPSESIHHDTVSDVSEESSLDSDKESDKKTTSPVTPSIAGQEVTDTVTEIPGSERSTTLTSKISATGHSVPDVEIPSESPHVTSSFQVSTESDLEFPTEASIGTSTALAHKSSSGKPQEISSEHVPEISTESGETASPFEGAHEGITSTPQISDSTSKYNYTKHPIIEPDTTTGGSIETNDEIGKMTSTHLPVINEGFTTRPKDVPASESTEETIQVATGLATTQPDIEDSTSTSTSRISGEGSCFVEGQTYKNGSRIPPSTPCQLACACQNSIVHCLLVHCKGPQTNNPLARCRPSYTPNTCCPKYECIEEGTGSTPITVTPEPSTLGKVSETIFTVTPESVTSGSEGASSIKMTETQSTEIVEVGFSTTLPQVITVPTLSSDHEGSSLEPEITKESTVLPKSTPELSTVIPKGDVTTELAVSTLPTSPASVPHHVPQGSTPSVSTVENETLQPNMASVTKSYTEAFEMMFSTTPSPSSSPDQINSRRPEDTTEELVSQSSTPGESVTSEASVSQENSLSPLHPFTDSKLSTHSPVQEVTSASTSSAEAGVSVSEFPSRGVTSTSLPSYHELSTLETSTFGIRPDYTSQPTLPEVPISTTTTSGIGLVSNEPAQAHDDQMGATGGTEVESTAALPNTTPTHAPFAENKTFSSEANQNFPTNGSDSAGDKYPVTTTTTVTPSPASWPYPSSSTAGPMSNGACLFDSRVYMSAQQIPRDDPCDFCFCFRGDIICLQQSCPPPIPACYEEPIPGFCCPRYECPVGSNSTGSQPSAPPSYYHTPQLESTNQNQSGIGSSPNSGGLSGPGCEIQGEYYEAGQLITATSGPCLECRCGSGGMMECDPRECQPEPMLRKMIEAITS